MYTWSWIAQEQSGVQLIHLVTHLKAGRDCSRIVASAIGSFWMFASGAPLGLRLGVGARSKAVQVVRPWVPHWTLEKMRNYARPSWYGSCQGRRRRTSRGANEIHKPTRTSSLYGQSARKQRPAFSLHPSFCSERPHFQTHQVKVSHFIWTSFRSFWVNIYQETTQAIQYILLDNIPKTHCFKV